MHKPERHVRNSRKPSPAGDYVVYTFTAVPEIPTLLPRKRPEARVQRSNWFWNTSTIKTDEEPSALYGTCHR